MKHQVRFWLRHGTIRDVVTILVDGVTLANVLLTAKANGYHATDAAFIPYDNIAAAIVEPMGVEIPGPGGPYPPKPDETVQ